MTGVTLWHVPLSHYSEKARWALDVKRLPHTRRRLVGGAHPYVTWVLTRGEHQTVPVLTVGRRGIGDSTAIIAELERRRPDPPLYPADPGERRRALELEDFFDEQLGPYIRRLAYHDLLGDPRSAADVTALLVPWARPGTMAVATRTLAYFLDLRFRVLSEDRARVAGEKVLAALDRLEAELDGREYLCGDAFSVADLTAASLFYPMVLPPEGPWRPSALPDAWLERQGELRRRPGYAWVAGMYARHRRPSGHEQDHAERRERDAATLDRAQALA